MSTSGNSEFVQMVRELMSSRNVTQTSLSASVGTSVAYTNHIVTGRTVPPAGWLNTASEAMKLTEEQRLELHKKAAGDLLRRRGYDVDLTKE